MARWIMATGRLQLADGLEPQVRLVAIRDLVREQGHAVLRPGARPAGSRPKARHSDSDAEPDPDADSFAERRSGRSPCGDRPGIDPESDRRGDLRPERPADAESD